MAEEAKDCAACCGLDEDDVVRGVVEADGGLPPPPREAGAALVTAITAFRLDRSVFLFQRYITLLARPI